MHAYSDRYWFKISARIGSETVTFIQQRNTKLTFNKLYVKIYEDSMQLFLIVKKKSQFDCFYCIFNQNK